MSLFIQRNKEIFDIKEKIRFMLGRISNEVNHSNVMNYIANVANEDSKKSDGNNRINMFNDKSRYS
jgi:hypothetical protein